MTSSGLDTMTKMASGLCFITFSVTVLTMPALVAIKSSRLIPGFRGNPLVMTTTSESAVFE